MVALAQRRYSKPTRFPNGATNVNTNQPFGYMGMFDQTLVHALLDDFNAYSAAAWTVTVVGVTPTAALANGDGGWLLLTTTSGATDSIFLDKLGEGFSVTAGKKAVFKARFKLSDSTNSAPLIGLQVTSTTPNTATDGIYFTKPTGAKTLSIFSRKDATTGSTSVTGVGTMADDTFINVAWYYDGKTTLNYYVNDVQTGSITSVTAFLPDTTLTPSFGFTNGAAAIKTMTIDYISAMFER